MKGNRWETKEIWWEHRRHGSQLDSACKLSTSLTNILIYLVCAYWQPIYYVPSPFWAPPLWAISPCTPFHVCPLWDLATWCAMSGIVLCGRGNLPALILLGELVCASLRCPHVLWESCSPLEWFWGYWGRSKQRHTLICCEHVIRPLLNIPAEFQGNRSRWRWRIVIGIGGWVRGEVGACASSLQQSGSLSLHCIGLPALSPRCVHIHV